MQFDIEDDQLMPELEEYDHPERISEQDLQEMW